MKPEDLRQLQIETPFRPFEIHMTDGRRYRVEHPEGIMILRHKVIVGVGDANAFDQADHCALLHIVRLPSSV